MKVVMVMLEGRGGMFQQAALLSNALSEYYKDCKITAIVPQHAETEFFNDAVSVISIPMGDTPRNFITTSFNVKNIIRLLKSIRQQRPSIVHFHNPYNPWTCMVLPFLRSYRIISSIPEGNLHSGMEKRYELIFSRDMHIAFSDAIIVLCEYDKLMTERYARNKKKYVVPHGINTLFCKYKRDDVAEDSILHFGAFAPFKGLEYLLDAFYLVRKEFPTARLLITGKGYHKYAELLKGIDGVELDDRFISKQKVAEYFQRAKMVVLPYIERDHSAIIPIAYAFRKPVIVSELVDDMVDDGKTGLIVQPKNVEALAPNVSGISRNPPS